MTASFPKRTPAGKQLMSWEKVSPKCGDISRAEAWRMRKNKTFPEPVKIGKRRVAWIAEEIEAWVQEQIDKRAAA